MQPSELINKLVAREGGALRVAKAMGNPSFQGTLHKLCAGAVKSPTRRTAERIARHFDIPLDALYDPKTATVVARERLLEPGGLQAGEPVKMYSPAVPVNAPLAALLTALGRELSTVPIGRRAELGDLMRAWVQAAGKSSYEALVAECIAGPIAAFRKRTGT